MPALKDLTGKTFGKWRVLAPSESRVSGRTSWVCECECGQTKVVTGNSLIKGSSKSCGCERNKQTSERLSLDLTGQRFGKLVATRFAGTRKNERYWECICDCGASKEVSTHALRTGNTNSCGCSRRQLQRDDLTGVRYGSLTAVSFSHNIIKKNGTKGQAYWIWICDCGTEVTAAGAGVRHRFEKRGYVGCQKCSAKKRAASRADDYTGVRFGRLVGVKQLDLSKSPALGRWLWQCDCGNTVERLPQNVKANPNSHCGCQPHSTAADRTGERFGRLVALRRIGKKAGENTYIWEFQCDCGNICQARLRDAVSGLQASCGCGQGGYDSVAAWIAGEFRDCEVDSFFYVFTLARFKGYSKPGIAEDLEARARASRGQYGCLHDYLALPRLECWLIEQALLRATNLFADCPDDLREAKWEGYSEVRHIEPEKLFKMAIDFHSQLLEHGREEFAIRFLVTTPGERKKLEAMKSE